MCIRDRRPDPADGTLAYDPRYCIGCGLCADACPEGAVELVETTAEALLPAEDDGGL